MNLQQRDEKHLWHPYTQHQTAAKPLGIVKGKDALLWDENGKERESGAAGKAVDRTMLARR